ncbi:Eco57I restriction-modification methylase domain-containing protein [Candidatus Poriferisocius sp.]|uniref:Eco57I restriction-modification methylase domain-containing protein n=1 Tax=Candidatus Poriferisocius sp. TaxID=3101276 RepID=UPI003B51DC9C
MSDARQLPLVEPQEPRIRAGDQGEYGEVFTRRWVVDLMLDLVGYVPEADLGAKVIVEPSCGRGAFLLPIVERLAESCASHGRRLSELEGAIAGFDLLGHNAEIARKAVVAKLVDLGETLENAERLAQRWVVTSDFLLSEEPMRPADFVVGNPPYVRLEDVPKEVSDAYRSMWPTMRGRADIYVGFFEKGLSLLGPGGRLAYICADRWMRNQYGAHLRKLVSSRYAVDSVMVMHDVDAFEEEVSAYPAITILRNGVQGPVRVVDANAAFDQREASLVLDWLRNPQHALSSSRGFEAGELTRWFEGPALWPAGSPKTLELLADLESRFAPLEDSRTGTRVGIGVATGCDEVYIRAEAEGVETDRLLPLLTAGDIATGRPDWSGKYLINPWGENGLVDLSGYPGLAGHFAQNSKQLRSRYVAQRQPRAWYRTIDRVDPELIDRPKLLLPDIKALSHPVLDPGGFYPHHNLYYVVSDKWDLEVLGGILLSDVANLFVGAYCVKMRGRTFRFQAQYLRKIRVPKPDAISSDLQQRLRNAFRQRDRSAATEAAAEAYGLNRGADHLGPPSAHCLQSPQI